LAWLFAAGAVDAAQPIVKSDELPNDTLIVLQRGACERRCAVYKAILFADGSVIFDGRDYVAKPGLAKTRISLETLKTLLDQAEALKFFDLEPTCATEDAAAPLAILTISTDRKSRTISHSLGCAGVEADGLKRLEDQIDVAVGSRRWLK
jgi:hypothetical protein